jgi:hypothetical protein
MHGGDDDDDETALTMRVIVALVCVGLLAWAAIGFVGWLVWGML